MIFCSDFNFIQFLWDKNDLKFSRKTVEIITFSSWKIKYTKKNFRVSATLKLVGCFLVYPTLKSSINDYKTLLSACWSCQLFLILYFLKHLFPYETSSFSPLHNSLPVVSLCHPWYCISFCFPTIRGSLVTSFLPSISCFFYYACVTN